MWNFVIMKANRIFLLFLVMAWMIILLSPALSHAKKETLVVMDLKPVGVGKNEAFILTERVRAAISKTRKFILVSREEMENIAKEQRFQVSDQCDSTSCYAEIGGALGAKKMVAGSVGKIGKTFTLTLKLIDIAKVKDVRTVNKDFSGEIDKFLPYVDQAGAELMGVVTAPIGGAGAPSIMPGVYKEDFSKLKRDVSKGVGSLYIKTVPAGAKVTINGVEQDGISPVTVNDLYEGEYIVEAVKGNYALRKKIEIKAMKYNKFTLELEHLTASLNIISEPAEARVYLDGEYKGETPLIIPKVHTGTHTIKIVKRSYFSLEQKLNITASSFEPKRFKLHQAAYLTVTSTPDQAKVIVGERELGKTPVELIFLPGEYAVKVEKDDFISQEKKVALKFGQKEILDFTLNNIYTRFNLLILKIFDQME